jgi:hypothetical protein
MRDGGIRFQIESENLFAEADRIFPIFQTYLLGGCSHNSGEQNSDHQKQESV